MRIFISYAHEQSQLAEAIYRKLLATGYEAFFGSDDIQASVGYDSRIRSEVDEADRLLFVASRESLTKGKFTLTEIRMFSEKWPDPTGRVMTVIVDDTPTKELPPYLGAVTSAFKPVGNIPSETVSAVVKQWPIKKTQWPVLKWAVVLLAAIVIFVTIRKFSDDPIKPKPVSPDTTTTDVPLPIEFNTGDDAITLFFNSHTLSRKDEFQIDRDKTVGYLKDSLKSHYTLTIPREFAERASDGGFYIGEELTADYQNLRGNQKILDTDIKENDVIRFSYILSARAPMACRGEDVFVVIEGISAIDPVFILNGDNKADKVDKVAGAHNFHIKNVGECNPSSWIGQLYEGDEVHFLANPEEISRNPNLVLEFKLAANEAED